MYAESSVGVSLPLKNESLAFSLEEEQELLNFIRHQKHQMHEAQDDFHSFHLLMRDLEKTLLKENEEDSFHARVVSRLEKHELDMLNKLYCLWETNLENRFVSFLKQGIVKHYLDYPLYARFERLIDREVRMLNGFKPKRLLFIGSGPMPITALCLQHRLGAQIDCLERHEEAVAESRHVMRLLNCEGDINIKQGYGEQIDASEYDAVLIALLAKPKFDILSNILNTGKDDVRIICRTSEGSRKVFYEPTEVNAIPAGLERVTHEKAGIDDTISSYLLRKV